MSDAGKIPNKNEWIALVEGWRLLRRTKDVRNATENDLLCALPFWEKFAEYSVLLIINGLWLEIVYAAAEAFLLPPTAPPNKFNEHLKDLISSFLIAMGVWLELYFSKRGNRVLEELRRRSELRTAETLERAAEAELRLRDAETNLDSMSKELDAAREKAAWTANWNVARE